MLYGINIETTQNMIQTKGYQQIRASISFLFMFINTYTTSHDVIKCCSCSCAQYDTTSHRHVSNAAGATT